MRINPNDARRVIDDTGLEVARFSAEDEALWYVVHRDAPQAAVPQPDQVTRDMMANIDRLLDENAQLSSALLGEKAAHQGTLAEVMELRAAARKKTSRAKAKGPEPAAGADVVED